ncbi:MAG TPA: ABC transporter permease, partial [Acidimicrobiales bacterium]|nr:ABC transporter permease [Acidimicrobiales bacterium]
MSLASLTRRAGRGQRSVLGLQRAGVVYAFVLIVVVFEILTAGDGLEGLLSVANVRNILDQSALDGVLVVPMTCLLITGNFDLSIGATAGLAAGVGLGAANHAGSVLGFVAAMAVGLAVGLVNGGLVQWVGVNAFIVTLGTLTAVQGVLLISSGGQTILASGNEFANIGSGFWTLWRGVPVIAGVLALSACAYLVWHDVLHRQPAAAGAADGLALTAGCSGALLLVVVGAFPGLLRESRETWIMLGYMAAVALFLRYTVFGRRLYAVGGNAEAARLSGVRLASYRVGAFVMCGLSAGFAGVLYAGKFGAVIPSALSTEELPVIAAAILGGTSLFGGSGYVVKSVLGVLILQTLTNGFALLNMGANLQYLVQGLVIIAAAAVYTVGGLRKRATRRALEQASPPGGEQPSGQGMPAGGGATVPVAPPSGPSVLASMASPE